MKPNETEPMEIDQELKRTSRAAKYEQITVTSSVDCLYATIDDDKIPDRVIIDAQMEMKSQLDRYRSKHREYVMMIEDEKEMIQETKLLEKMQAL